MRAAALAALIAAFYASAPAPSAGTCTDTCDKTAATCVDACEAKFPTDPSPRISCKLDCAKKRETCESSCARH